jgi:hypothetical protein
MSHWRTSNLSRSIAVGVLMAAPLCTHSALAEGSSAVFDARLGYPLVLNSGPGDSRYEGNYMMDFRFLGIGKSVGVGVGFEYFRFTNRVPASGPASSEVSSSAMAMTLDVAFPIIKGSESSVLDDLILNTSFGLGSRSIGGVDGSMLAATIGADVAWYLHPIHDGAFTLAPTAAIEYISEGRHSNIGALSVATFGARIGWKWR